MSSTISVVGQEKLKTSSDRAAWMVIGIVNEDSEGMSVFCSAQTGNSEGMSVLDYEGMSEGM